MKNLAKYLLIVTASIIASCSGGGDKFTGKWKISGNAYIHVADKSIVVITKVDGHYNMSDGKQNGSLITFDYDSKTDCLNGNAGGMAVDIRYLKDSRHIALVPHALNNADIAAATLTHKLGMNEFLELEKAE